MPINHSGFLQNFALSALNFTKLAKQDDFSHENLHTKQTKCLACQ